MPDPELMVIEEAAEYVRLPLATMRFYRHKKVGPLSARIGRRVMYRKADLDCWIADQFTADALNRA